MPQSTTQSAITQLLTDYINENRWYRRMFNFSLWFDHHVDIVEEALERYRARVDAAERDGKDVNGYEVELLEEIARTDAFPEHGVRGHFPPKRRFNAAGEQMVNLLKQRVLEAREPLNFSGNIDAVFTAAMKVADSDDELDTLLERLFSRDGSSSRSKAYLDNLINLLLFAVGNLYRDSRRRGKYITELGLTSYSSAVLFDKILHHIADFSLSEKLYLLGRSFNHCEWRSGRYTFRSEFSVDHEKFGAKNQEREALIQRIREAYIELVTACRSPLEFFPLQTANGPSAWSIFIDNIQFLLERGLLTLQQQRGIFEILKQAATESVEGNHEFLLHPLKSPEILGYLRVFSANPDNAYALGEWLLSSHALGASQSRPVMAYISASGKDCTTIIDKLCARHKVMLLCGISSEEGRDMPALASLGNDLRAEDILGYILNSESLRNRFFRQYSTRGSATVLQNLCAKTVAASMQHSSWFHLFWPWIPHCEPELLRNRALMPPLFFDTLLSCIEAGDADVCRSADALSKLMSPGGKAPFLSWALLYAMLLENEVLTAQIIAVLKQLDRDTQKRFFSFQAGPVSESHTLFMVACASRNRRVLEYAATLGIRPDSRLQQVLSSSLPNLRLGTSHTANGQGSSMFKTQGWKLGISKAASPAEAAPVQNLKFSDSFLMGMLSCGFFHNAFLKRIKSSPTAKKSYLIERISVQGVPFLSLQSKGSDSTFYEIQCRLKSTKMPELPHPSAGSVFSPAGPSCSMG